MGEQVNRAYEEDKLYELEYDQDIDLDQKDKQILQELQIDGRKNVTDIARSTGISREVVQYRLEKLETNNVIRFYQAILDPSKLGYPLYTYALIDTQATRKEKHEAFLSDLKDKDNVIYLAETSGDWDIAMLLCAEHLKKIDTLAQSIQREYHDIIEEIHRATIKEEHKHHFMADLIKPGDE